MEKVHREIFFSIIIPIYNMEKYLEKCINSIICQKFDGYEIILVDDGSRDSSFQIAQKLSEQYRNIKCFKKENGGVASARNYGIEKAEGEYLIFLDADDKLGENALEDAYETITSENLEGGVELLYAVHIKSFVKIQSKKTYCFQIIF